MRFPSMLKRLAVFLFINGIVAEWVKIPVLNPEKESAGLADKSYLTLKKIDPYLSDPNSDESVTEIQNRIGEINKIEKAEENSSDLNGNIMVDNFLQNLMNNSQAGSTGMDTTSSQLSLSPYEIMKNIHLSLLYPSPISSKGKVIFLENLKQKLYTYIKPRVLLFWDDKGRQGRTDKGMGFPSMDGALMTISFLLFAVFLIKLVQQLIQQVQDKANAQAMLMTGATPVVATPAGGRRRRDVPSDVYAAAQLFHLMDQFRAKDYT